MRRAAQSGREPFAQMRVPKMFNLRADPFEDADGSMFYDRWSADLNYNLVIAQKIVGEWLSSFKEFPPRAKAASFSVDQVVEALMPKS
jgi:arylsulfatase